LRLALNQLGLGPCYHMYEAFPHMPVYLPLWLAALEGRGDWDTIYKGYASAVDWPTASFISELNAAYPHAKFILTVRNAREWAESFSETIYMALAGADQAPADFRPRANMLVEVVAKSGFPLGLDVAGLANAFEAHTEAVKAAIPPERLLVYEVKEGWSPICEFLGVPDTGEPFPRTNSRDDFWEALQRRRAGAA
jgi:hypothetical protein